MVCQRAAQLLGPWRAGGDLRWRGRKAGAAIFARGELIVCEDGGGDNFLRAVAPDGLVYLLARNADAAKSEFAGACFSPDGATLFVNVQKPGITFAITGNWDALRREARRAA